MSSSRLHGADIEDIEGYSNYDENLSVSSSRPFIHRTLVVLLLLVVVTPFVHSNKQYELVDRHHSATY